MTGVSFWAAGQPRPQGSKRAFVVKGRPIVTEQGGANHRQWRDTVTVLAHASMNGQPPFAGPVAVELTFVLPRPKSHPKTKRTWPIARPDIDKLARTVLDSLTQVVFADDSQVVRLYLRKIWAQTDTDHGPGVNVNVHALTPERVQ